MDKCPSSGDLVKLPVGYIQNKGKKHAFCQIAGFRDTQLHLKRPYVYIER